MHALRHRCCNAGTAPPAVYRPTRTAYSAPRVHCTARTAPPVPPVPHRHMRCSCGCWQTHSGRRP
eukprot:364956-Chlamydomonas_euryale.AAC.6